MADVAKAAGVSVMTVSRALRGVEGVSPAMRLSILRTAEELGYSRNSVAASLAASHSTLIGISFPTLSEVVFSDIFHPMRAVFDHAGFQTVIDTTEYSPAREAAWVERILAWHPAAVVLTGVHHTPEARERLVRSGLPVVELWARADSPIDLAVGIDHAAAGRAMGQHMLAGGYRAPACIGVAEGHDPRAEQRFSAFLGAFLEAGCRTPVRVAMPDTSFVSGRNGLLRLMAEHPDTDAIYFLHDHMAVGGLMAAEALGLSVPERLGIAGFNGLNVNEVLGQRITTANTPRDEIGQVAARAIVARIAGARVAPIPLLAAPLVPGDTTRPVH